MKNWYKKPVTKAVLFVLLLLSTASVFTSLVLICTFAGGTHPADIWGSENTPYEESAGFHRTVESTIVEIIEQEKLKSLFETDGEYDPNKTVDVIAYAENGELTGESDASLTYRLEDLYRWGQEYYENGSDLYDENGVIVCEKPDGTYYYYYLEEFRQLVEDRQLNLNVIGEDVQTFREELENGYYTSPGYSDVTLEDETGKVVYTDCWNFGMPVKEKYTPENGENILEIVNHSPQLNGKLAEVYEDLDAAINNIYQQVRHYQTGLEYLEEGNTNLAYIYEDSETGQIYTNRAVYRDPDRLEENIQKLISSGSDKYIVIRPKLADFETNMDIDEGTYWDMVRSHSTDGKWEGIFAVSVDTDFPIQDMFYSQKEGYNENLPFIKASFVVGGVSLILWLAAAIWLTLVAGRSAEDEAVHLRGLDRCKTEIAAVLVVGVWALGTAAVSNNWLGISSAYITAAEIVVLSIYGLFTALCFFGGYFSLVRRIKAKTMWKNSLTRMAVRFLVHIWKNRSVLWKELCILIGFILLHWLAAISGGYWMVIFLALAADVGAAYFIVGNAVAKSRIKKGIEQIASGDLTYQISLSGLRGTNLEMAERVNDIGNGLNRAVEASMKSERLKTDLITNVSHDIKTPLTSIINYVDLLKRENIQDEKIQGYLEILEAKAQRLKVLTEDVVEASKVSSGNIKLEYMDVDLAEMIQQTEVQIAEKFADRNLKVITNLPEQAAVIHVDGRRMWRVLENIYGNAAKYALPGTRVYADLKIEDGKVKFSLKNISEQPLNISADELTERFIRGDVSRSTEGSGLGLSIATSLVKMQGGILQLYLDGDLFKVELEFPRVKDR